MTKIERVGRTPCNARIFINYNQTPPSIEFGYPDKDVSVVRKSDVTWIIAGLFSVMMLMIIAMSFSLWLIPKMYPHISNSDVTIHRVNVSYFNYANGSHISFDSLLVTYTWNEKLYTSRIVLNNYGFLMKSPQFFHTMTMSQTKQVAIEISIWLILLIGLMYLNTFWVSKVFINTKWGNKKYPQLNKRLHNARYSVEYTPSNFPINKVIEIPLFTNMYLDYDAVGDFAKQLISVEITEHPFNLLVKKGSIFNRKTVKKPNIYLWKCILKFKEVPKDGKMEVRFT